MNGKISCMCDKWNTNEKMPLNFWALFSPPSKAVLLLMALSVHIDTTSVLLFTSCVISDETNSAKVLDLEFGVGNADHMYILL